VSASLQFLVLGPLEVRDGSERLTLGPRKQRALLAILLLHANEVVSIDRLVDMLWGESPPDTATTALHGYVSQLRKVLEPERRRGDAPRVLVTHEPGYVLRLEPDQLDLERFTTLVRTGRDALGAGRADDASTALRAALELWRGPPLADLDAEPFLQAELPRLVELKAAAVEERFDADLALGRHPAVVADLEDHIARHPLRERPRAQLMLALYRGGRQAEALRVFQDARRTLVEDVGIEPGPALRELERAILEQDPALELDERERVASAPATAPPPSRPRRLPRHSLPVAAIVLGAVATAVAFTAGGSGSDEPVTVRAGSVAVIDLGSGRVTDAVRVGGTPTSLSIGEGGVWALDADRQVVSRIDPKTYAVRTFGTGSIPTDLAAGAGALWVANGRKGSAQFVGPLATTLSSIDPDSSAIRATVALPRKPGATSNVSASHLAVTRDAVWVVNPDFSVSRIDPRSSRITRTIASVSALAVAAGDGSVWVLNDDNSLARVDRRRPSTRVQVASNGLSANAVGAGAVWATAPYDGVLWRIDPEPRLVQRTIAVGEGASFVTVGGGFVWVVNALRGTVSQIDPSTNRVVDTIDLGGTPRSAAVGAGKLWVTVGGADAVPAARSTASAGAGALPADTCGRVVYGGKGSPDRLIVSDLPLRGVARRGCRRDR
jgi:YVTN family beta-propeller protein